jgi:hypothetical protein
MDSGFHWRDINKEFKRDSDQQSHKPMRQIDMHHSIVVPDNRRLRFQCEAYNARSCFPNFTYGGTVRLGI